MSENPSTKILSYANPDNAAVSGRLRIGPVLAYGLASLLGGMGLVLMRSRSQYDGLILGVVVVVSLLQTAVLAISLAARLAVMRRTCRRHVNVIAAATGAAFWCAEPVLAVAPVATGPLPVLAFVGCHPIAVAFVLLIRR